MTTPQGPAATLIDLRTALREVGDALVAASLDRMTSAEAALAAAAAGLPHITSSTPPDGDRQRLRDEILAVQAALARCQRLGGSLGRVVHATLAAQGRLASYDRHGGEAVHPPAQGGFGVRG